MSEVKNVSLSSLAPNPMRKLAKYPFNEDKIDALRRSIKDVGLWEGVIARRQGGEYQIAFGHHRVEASKKELGRDARVPVIVRELTDKQMIQFMGRENLEDYNADFLVMLESWEAAAEFMNSEKPEPLDIAMLLGWTSPKDGKPWLSIAARAANSASKLIEGGYIRREALVGLNVSAVRLLCERIIAQHEMTEKMAKVTKRPRSEVEQVKRVVGRAGEKVAKRIKAGEVAHTDIRGEIDVTAYRHSKGRQSPLFAAFGRSLADQIERVLSSDTIAEKLNEVKAALSQITLTEDRNVIERLALECKHLAARAEKFERTFDTWLDGPRAAKVVPLKQIAGGRT